ncbi:MAG: bifunctional phosphoglucose/phosphomannose isomerase [Patescibacteria group bacterium]
MVDLDSLEEINELDRGRVHASIERLPAQIKQAWSEVKGREVPSACNLAKNVLISGMGGSALGGRIVDSLLADRARVPIEVFTEYNLPNYVNKDTLVIVSSYSGNTEETVSAAKEALNRGAMVYVISTGGRLAEILKEEKLEGYIFDPKENPSNQPRMGLGYSIASVLAVLSKCEFINLLDSEIEEACNEAEKFISEFGLTTPEAENLAKKMAKRLKGKVPIIIASEHLLGSVHAFKNQMNENAKTFALIFDIPELNHHLMEGLKNPYQIKELLSFLFIESERYSKRVQLRYPLTKEVVEKNGIIVETYRTRSFKKIQEIFELLVLGSDVSFYLAMLYNQDPTPIPWVDYFKSKLSQT